MSMPQPVTVEKFTIEQYLSIEREAEERHEYVDGEIIAMAGESGAHADISANLVGLLYTQLKGKTCRARTKDTKVRSGPNRPHGSSTKGLFSYPDVVVICGEPIYHDEHSDVVLNPTAIIEVLSPSTERFDRGLKFQRLASWNPTLVDYVLVSQQQPMVEVFHRTGETTWSLNFSRELDETAELTSIDCRLALSAIYDRIEFPPPEELTEELPEDSAPPEGEEP